jgi:hypothetical protein
MSEKGAATMSARDEAVQYLQELNDIGQYLRLGADEKYYVLDTDGALVPATRLQWLAWIEIAESSRIIEDTLISESPYSRVLTVFLGYDDMAKLYTGPKYHGIPLIFETSIFRDNDPPHQYRNATRAEALADHAREVDLAKSGPEFEAAYEQAYSECSDHVPKYKRASVAYQQACAQRRERR